jgi:hypothetical protein
MTDQSPQVPHAYYYAPYVEGGKYENNLSQLGQATGQMLVAFASYELGGAYDPQAASNTAMGMLGTIVGSITQYAFGQVGQLVDNLPVISQNIETALGQLNDASSWMSPDLSN